MAAQADPSRVAVGPRVRPQAGRVWLVVLKANWERDLEEEEYSFGVMLRTFFARVPAVLEYIPYRKRDMTALRDGATHGYLAGHGYACVRLDVRGVGDSDGVYGDQFTAQYAEDAVEAIAWLARQPWCSGTVGMVKSVQPSSWAMSRAVAPVWAWIVV